MAEETKTPETEKNWADSIEVKEGADTTPAADSKILNQDEIDSLLGYGDSGETEYAAQKPVSAPSLIPAWSLTSACRCWKLFLTA